MMLRFSGKMPVALNPDCAISTEQDFVQAGVKTEKKPGFPRLLPPVVLTASMPSFVQLVFKLLKNDLSVGCRLWVVCAGNTKGYTLLAFIRLTNSKL